MEAVLGEYLIKYKEPAEKPEPVEGEDPVELSPEELSCYE